MNEVSYSAYSVEAVADYILNYAKEHEITDVTNLKLQKLVYFAQGFVLAYLNYPLFVEDIEAWTYGPVIPRLYRMLRDNGDDTLQDVPWVAADHVEKGSDPAKRIDQMLELIGTMKAGELVNLSHAENSPWYITWNRGYGRCDVISLWLMLRYFKTVLEVA